MFFNVIAMHIDKFVNTDTCSCLISFFVVFGNVSEHNYATQTTLCTIADISISAEERYTGPLEQHEGELSL